MSFSSKDHSKKFYKTNQMGGNSRWIFAWALLIGLWPSDLWAQSPMAGTSLGAIICNARLAWSAFPDFFNALGYIAGAIIILRGVLMMKKSTDAPSQVSPGIGIAHLIGGSLLMTLPLTIGVLQRTLFLDAGGTTSTCAPGALGGGGGGSVGLDIMAQNFVRNIHGPVFNLISLLSFLIGVVFVFMGLMKGTKTGTDPRAANPRDIMVYLAIGAVLTSMGTVLPMMLRTIFGGAGDISDVSGFSGIAWSTIVGAGADTTAADNTVRALLGFIQIVGGIGFLRGWLLIKKAVEGGQATIPQGLAHIIGGAMAINIDVMLEVFDQTFGTNLINPT